MTRNQEPGTRISNISHFFLSEQKKEDGNGNGNGNGEKRRTDRVCRIPPEKHPYPPPQQTGQSERADPSCLSQADTGTGSGKKFETIGVINSHLRWDGAKGLSQFARLLAKDEKTVGVLKLQGWTAQFNMYHHQSFEYQVTKDNDYSEDLLTNAEPEEDTEEKLTIFDKLNANIGKLDCLVLTWGPEFEKYNDNLIQLSDKICVITTPADEHLVGAYQAVKQLTTADRNSPSIGIFVAHADNPNKAQSVSSRLIQTAEEHLKVHLANFGHLLSEPMVTSELIFREEIRQSPDDDTDKWVSELEKWVVGNVQCSMFNDHGQRTTDEGQSKMEDRNGDEIHIVNIDDIMCDDSEQFLALHIGKKILCEYKPSGSDLIDFLRSMKLRCAKFKSKISEQKDVFVIVVLKDDDLTLVNCAVEYYPAKTDKLIILSEHQLGRMERAAYERNFADLQIIPIIRGKSEGKETIVLSS